MPLPIEYEVNEGTTKTWTATIVGDDGVTVVPLANLTTIVLTLYAIISSGAQTIINGRDAQNVLNLNNVTIHATSGLLTWAIQIADTTLVENIPFERHIALFEWTLANGAAGKHELILVVKNLQQVP